LAKAPRMTDSDARPLVFMHIPKTSGMAVENALVKAVAPRWVTFGFDLSFFGNFTAFDTLAPQNRDFVHFSADSFPRDGVLVRGHMAYSTLRAAYPNARFMTVLREPVCRLMSHFLFWRGFGDAELASWGEWRSRTEIAAGSLTNFLQAPSIACQADNMATRLLLWPHAKIPDAGFIDPADDDQLITDALAVLAKFDFAEAVENPHFAARLSGFLQSPVALERFNETKIMPLARRANLAQLLTNEAQALLMARTRLDAILWRHVMGEHALMRAAVVEKMMVRSASLLAGQ